MMIIVIILKRKKKPARRSLPPVPKRWRTTIIIIILKLYTIEMHNIHSLTHRTHAEKAVWLVHCIDNNMPRLPENLAIPHEYWLILLLPNAFGGGGGPKSFRTCLCIVNFFTPFISSHLPPPFLPFPLSVYIPRSLSFSLSLFLTFSRRLLSPYFSRTTITLQKCGVDAHFAHFIFNFSSLLRSRR